MSQLQTLRTTEVNRGPDVQILRAKSSFRRDAERLQARIDGHEPTVQLAQSRLGTLALRWREVSLAQSGVGVGGYGLDLAENAMSLGSQVVYLNFCMTVHGRSFILRVETKHTVRPLTAVIQIETTQRPPRPELISLPRSGTKLVKKWIAALVVEDNALVRFDLAQTLEAEGYETFGVADATEAIAVLEAQSEISVVFTDIQMPGTMDGLALSHYVIELPWSTM